MAGGELCVGGSLCVDGGALWGGGAPCGSWVCGGFCGACEPPPAGAPPGPPGLPPPPPPPPPPWQFGHGGGSSGGAELAKTGFSVIAEMLRPVATAAALMTRFIDMGVFLLRCRSALGAGHVEFER